MGLWRGPTPSQWGQRGFCGTPTAGPGSEDCGEGRVPRPRARRACLQTRSVLRSSGRKEPPRPIVAWTPSSRPLTQVLKAGHLHPTHPKPRTSREITLFSPLHFPGIISESSSAARGSLFHGARPCHFSSRSSWRAGGSSARVHIQQLDTASCVCTCSWPDKAFCCFEGWDGMMEWDGIMGWDGMMG